MRDTVHDIVCGDCTVASVAAVRLGPVNCASVDNLNLDPRPGQVTVRFSDVQVRFGSEPVLTGFIDL